MYKKQTPYKSRVLTKLAAQPAPAPASPPKAAPKTPPEAPETPPKAAPSGDAAGKRKQIADLLGVATGKIVDEFEAYGKLLADSVGATDVHQAMMDELSKKPVATRAAWSEATAGARWKSRKPATAQARKAAPPSVRRR